MPDVIGRDVLESLLASAVGKQLRNQLRELMDLLGDPPNLGRVTEAFWLNSSAELRATVEPILRDIYLQQAQEQLGQVSIGVDWALVNQDAVEWARTYAFDLVSQISDKNRELLQSAIGGYFNQPQTIGQLQGALEGAFGPVRAEMISITEVTRASVAGEQNVVDKLVADNPGIASIDVWQTNRDDRVCPICGPRHNKARGSGWVDNPPAHPRCRCWLKHDFERSANG